MNNVTEVVFSERQGLAKHVLDPDNEQIVCIFLNNGVMSWDMIGEIGRHEMIGALHELIHDQLNSADEDEEEAEN